VQKLRGAEQAQGQAARAPWVKVLARITGTSLRILWGFNEPVKPQDGAPPVMFVYNPI